jgi:hypothetical protein
MPVATKYTIKQFSDAIKRLPDATLFRQRG